MDRWRRNATPRRGCRSPRNARRCRAFTLVEALLAAVILSMTVCTIIVPFAAGGQNDLANSRGALAISLAQDLMEEILAKPFSDPDDGNHTPGPDGGESLGRAYFDNVDDYSGYAEAAGTIRYSDSTAPADPLAETLSRSVEVVYCYVAGQDTSRPPTVCRVVVRVQHEGADLARLTRLVYANEKEP